MLTFGLWGIVWFTVWFELVFCCLNCCVCIWVGVCGFVGLCDLLVVVVVMFAGCAFVCCGYGGFGVVLWICFWGYTVLVWLCTVYVTSVILVVAFWFADLWMLVGLFGWLVCVCLRLFACALWLFGTCVLIVWLFCLMHWFGWLEVLVFVGTCCLLGLNWWCLPLAVICVLVAERLLV